MLLKCGYNCINLTIPRTFKTCRFSLIENKDYEKLMNIILANFELLGDIIKYNISKDIRMFRVSSGLIPFLSTDEVLDWMEEIDFWNHPIIADECERIRMDVEKYNIDISVHPGQYNVLNSDKKYVVKRTISELYAQNDLMNMLGGETIVLHLGSSLNHKLSGKKRFIQRAKDYLSEDILSKLSLENDDKVYTSEDVIEVINELNCDWVFDYHHELLNTSVKEEASKLIKKYPPKKYHICEGRGGKLVIPHDDFISKYRMQEFINFLTYTKVKEAKVMFEAKAKNLALERIMRNVGNGLWELDNRR